MKKYYFDEKLQEGILHQNCGILTATVGRTEYNPVFPPGRTPRNVENDRIPCLILKCSSSERDDTCIVEAVSMDSADQKRKNWLCISTILLENAVGFFLSKKMMQEITGDFKNLIRNQKIASLCLDFFTDNGTIIEVKSSFASIDAVFGRTQKRKHPILTPGQIMGYVNILNMPMYAESRMALLAIQQHGLEEIYPDFAMNGRTYESIKTGCVFGLELWTAVMQTDADGISLLSYRCITEDILSGTRLRHR